jgi:ABC-2 type transport system permease protein
MSPLATILLIAGRELRTRLKAKSFVYGTLGLLVVIGGYLALSAWLANSSGPTIAVSGSATQLRPAIEAVAKSIDKDLKVKAVEEDKGRQQVRDGDLDALVLDASSTPNVVVNEELDSSVRGVLDTVLQQRALQTELTKAGANAAEVQQAVAAAGVRVHTLTKPDPDKDQRLVLASVAMGLLYIALITYGSAIAQGVVEEKTSRVVEVLLATVRPWHLLFGKLLGIGLVGLVQLVILGAVGLLGGTASGQLTLPGTGAATFGVLIIGYLLGFFLFASLFAAAGALVARYEDLQSVITPLIMTLAVVFVLGLNLLIRDPRSGLVEALSLIPPFSTILMPARIVLGVAPVWEIALSLVLTIGALILVIRLAGTVYRRGILHTGSRLSLRAALRTQA